MTNIETSKINFEAQDSLFGSDNSELYGAMDNETLDDLIYAAYERYNESEKIILDIQREKMRRNESNQ